MDRRSTAQQARRTNAEYSVACGRSASAAGVPGRPAVNPALDTELSHAPPHTEPRPHSALYSWLATTEHTAIGRRFIATALTFFVLGGVLALIMRLQLATPSAHVVGPDRYNQIFTTHGSTMMFLFAVPVMQGLGLYFVPLMVGARNLAFPRLANFA